jgi:hypothetical protein
MRLDTAMNAHYNPPALPLKGWSQTGQAVPKMRAKN